MKSIVRMIRDLRGYAIFAFSLFILAAIYGYTSDTLHAFLQKQLEAISVIAQQLSQQPNREASFFWFIFINNAVKSIIVLFAGIILGLLPVVFIVVNGMVLGYMFYIIGLDPNASTWGVFLKGILPHGILEIPAILLAAAFGIKLGITAIKDITRKIGGDRREAELLNLFKQSIPFGLFIIGVLLVAAFVEAYITTKLISS